MKTRPASSEKKSENVGPDEIAPVIGPPDWVEVVFSGLSSREAAPGHLFVEEFEVSRKELRVSGWAHCPGAAIREIRLPPPWEKRLVYLRKGTERGDIQARFGGGENALHSGFSFLAGIPEWFRSFTFVVVFDNGRNLEVKLRGKTADDLKNRFLKNLGHRYFSWAKPLKQIVRKPGYASKAPGLERVLTLRECHAGSDFGQVILPVFNGLHFLKKLLPRLREDPGISRLIIIDDASTDPGVTTFLETAAADCPKIDLIQNRENLGFVKSVNKGFRIVSDDFVLLNTDVEVPPGWIGRLLEPIRRDASVATTTPFTNAGTIMSFPESLVDNDCFSDLPVEVVDGEFQNLRSVEPVSELPSGVGFCMGMSLRALRDVGRFDEAGFGRGYGEENDWCQRAIRKGYCNVPVLNLYVYHRHGGSYRPEEKKSLLEEHLKLMARKHPFYHRDVQSFVQSDPLRRHREVGLLRVLAQRCSRGVCLVIDHQEGGGASFFSRRRIAEAQDEGFFPLMITFDRRSGEHRIKAFHPRWSGTIPAEDETECFQIVRALGLRKILLNSLVFFPRPFAMLREILDLTGACPEAEMDVFLHDYHGICPSHNLIDSEGKYCGVPDESACRECLKSNPQVHGSAVSQIGAWRSEWHQVFKKSKTVRAFSETSAELMAQVFPEIADHLCTEPHRQYYFSSAVRPPVPEDPARPVVAVVGNIGRAKGASVVTDLAREGGCRMVVVGKLAPGFETVRELTVHGAYEREMLPELLERYGVSVCLIPSIWPETYNFVADELMTLSMPVVSFDIGAHAGRIDRYARGKIVPLALAGDPVALSREIRDFCAEFPTTTDLPEKASAV